MDRKTDISRVTGFVKAARQEIKVEDQIQNIESDAIP
jgi:hypothetical protein